MIPTILADAQGMSLWWWLPIAPVGLIAVTALLMLLIPTGDMPLHVRFWWNTNRLYCRVWFGMRIRTPVTIPPEGPVVLVANHTSSIDPVLLIASVRHRPLGFMIAREFYDLPAFGRLIKMMECIPVNRDGQDTAATRAALRHLKDGKLLGIFIEGRIAKPGEEIEPKEGAALLALRTGALVVPAHVSGTYYSDDVAQSFFRPQRTRIRFGEPIDLSKLADPHDRDALPGLSRMLMDRIRELGEDTSRPG